MARRVIIFMRARFFERRAVIYRAGLNGERQFEDCVDFVCVARAWILRAHRSENYVNFAQSIVLVMNII